MRILHLSDTHLMAPGEFHNPDFNGGTDPAQMLTDALHRLRHLDRLDLVVVSGDVSDDGTVDSYQLGARLIGGWARERGAEVVWAVGNHDERGAFRRVLGNGVAGAVPDEGLPAGGHPGEAPVYGVTTVAGRRVVTVDSQVSGRIEGRVDAGQLAWLRGVLAQPAGGTVLVCHHPPIAPHTPLHHGIELQNPAELLDVLAGSDVELILSGHYHHPVIESVTVAGGDGGTGTGPRSVPVLVSHGIINTSDLLCEPGWEQSMRTSGALLVEWGTGGDRARVRTHPLQLADHPLAIQYDPAEVARLKESFRQP